MRKRASTDRDRLGAQLTKAARHWRRAADQRLQPYGLTEAMWLPLVRISRSPKPMRQKDLAATLMVDNSAVVRLLFNLEKAGLVTREEGTDRRAKILALTDAGREIVDRVEAVGAELKTLTLSTVSAEDIAVTLRVLDHIVDTLAPADEERF